MYVNLCDERIRSPVYNELSAFVRMVLYACVAGAPNLSTGATPARMASIFPFKALRYNPAKVNPEDVVTQPYDKISPEMQQKYYDRSPYNLVRVILGKSAPGDTDADNVYTRAATDLAAWRAKGILAEEAQPAVYAYSQTYTVPGSTEVRERRGFIALGQLYDYAEQVIFRHEQTLSKPKSDRLNLFKATRAYCEQIYLLYSDPTFAADNLLFDGSTPEVEVTDEYGVIHRLWKIADPKKITQLCAEMADKKLIIADGHHRYETSVAYARERAAELGKEMAPPEPARGKLPQPAFPEAAMMMTFVNMDAPGITILPTHRVVFGINNFNPSEFLGRVTRFFDVKKLPVNDPTPLMDQLAAATQPKLVSMIAVTREGKYLLTSKKAAVNTALGDISKLQRQLDVVQLHSLILEEILGLSQESVREQRNLRYLRNAQEAVDQVASHKADIAFLINPCTLEQLKDVAFALDVMPQKSTDFYPKLLSGLAIYALD